MEKTLNTPTEAIEVGSQYHTDLLDEAKAEVQTCINSIGRIQSSLHAAYTDREDYATVSLETQQAEYILRLIKNACYEAERTVSFLSRT